jgi:AraC-like DNA-binding protein
MSCIGSSPQIPSSNPHHSRQEEVAMTINIEQVKCYIDENLHHLRKAEQVALQLNYPVGRLNRSFLRRESLSLSRYLRASRITRMKEQLQNTEKPCKVICLDLGLREDVGARLFKNATGMTMENYRCLCRHDRPGVLRHIVGKKSQNKQDSRLVLTERVVRQMVEATARRTQQGSGETGILIQGPSH